MTTRMLLTDFPASHSVLTGTTRTETDPGVERGSPEGRAHQMTQWLCRGGGARDLVRQNGPGTKPEAWKSCAQQPPTAATDRGNKSRC